MSKRCNNCGKRYADEHTFCTQCGTSFDAKYCSRLHRNERGAAYCQACGSSDLSTPHERSDGLGFLLLLLAAIASVVVIVVMVVTLPALLAESQYAGVMLLVTILAAVLTVAWSRWKNRW